MDSKEKVKQKSTKSRLQKRVRILAVITSLSVIITFTTIITSIVICLYFKKQSSELEVFAEETAEDQNGEDEEAVEAVSGGIVYTQEEVDSMVTLRSPMRSIMRIRSFCRSCRAGWKTVTGR